MKISAAGAVRRPVLDVAAENICDLAYPSILRKAFAPGDMNFQTIAGPGCSSPAAIPCTT